MAMENENLDDLEKLNLDELLKSGNPQEIRKNLMDMLDSADLTDEMKENLRNMLAGNTPQVLGGSGPWLAIVFVLLIFSVIRKSDLFLCREWFESDPFFFLCQLSRQTS